MIKNKKFHLSLGTSKGEDGYRTFSIRLKKKVVDKLDKLSFKTCRSRNEIISLMIDFSLENYEEASGD